MKNLRLFEPPRNWAERYLTPAVTIVLLLLPAILTGGAWKVVVAIRAAAPF